MTTCTALEAPSPLSSTPAWHCTCAHQRKSQDPSTCSESRQGPRPGQQPGSLSSLTAVALSRGQGQHRQHHPCSHTPVIWKACSLDPSRGQTLSSISGNSPCQSIAGEKG